MASLTYASASIGSGRIRAAVGQAGRSGPPTLLGIGDAPSDGVLAGRPIKPARVAELPYATVALVTDYDSWRVMEEAVGTEEILETLTANADAARRLVARAAPCVPADPDTAATSALAGALITPFENIPPARMEQLELLLQRYAP